MHYDSASSCLLLGVITADNLFPFLAVLQIYLCHLNDLHILSPHIHKPTLWPSSFPLTWQLHLPQISPSISRLHSSASPLTMSLNCPTFCCKLLSTFPSIHSTLPALLQTLLLWTIDLKYLNSTTFYNTKLGMILTLI